MLASEIKFIHSIQFSKYIKKKDIRKRSMSFLTKCFIILYKIMFVEFQKVEKITGGGNIFLFYSFIIITIKNYWGQGMEGWPVKCM